MKVFGVVGWKNSGKTTLVERLVTEITARGLTVSTIKRAHHRVDVDQEGTDSWRHRAAGAREVMLASSTRWALMHELGDEEEPPLDGLLARMTPVDLVIVEGFKRSRHDKLEVHRAESGGTLLAREDATVRAIATDTALPDLGRPVLSLDDVAGIADLILAETGLGR
ncbi:molybdopterin-guanine dinucleotide biosynthesis protein B [Acuticoccus sediminis]|uniref:Molybdopterin-guanine dinucleotide biosynthesis protein B n=1 Tax=Acuticoccus sediminis TaxID=2184697 RepID=A0A8B2NRU3_9HYPH|nr:molybdopterin-guanine dinucleotide biosynthesis protein B [Acuticoccus sediminis]RAI00779.1 molybdopterin-guanine dinucleotide biosynthesis protein B [Acuticoccus sediminis]